MKKIILTICLLFAINAYAVTGDVNNDGKVNTLDLYVFADEWLTSGTLCDFVNDDIVNFRDFAVLAENWTGDTSSPSKAENPDPANSETGVLLNQVLSWSAARATSYDVYFGTVNPPPFIVNQVAQTYDPAIIDTTTYYWRIDAKGNNQTVTGDVWNFTTAANIAPTASDITSSTATYVPVEITLIGSDVDNNPYPKLKYVITDLPSDATAYVQDTVSGGQSKVKESDLPYTLSSWGKIIRFATSTAGTKIIKYKAFDGKDYSAEKTITITVTANLQDLISINGGYITIPDTGNYFDFVAGTAIGCVFQTHNPFCTIMSKLENGTGYQVRLVAGHIVVNIYSGGSVVSTATSLLKYNTGKPVNFVFIDNNVTGKLELDIGTGTVGGTWYEDTEALEGDYSATLPVGDYSNAASLIVGGSDYVGEIDAIRCYVNVVLTDVLRSIIGFQQRTIAGDSEMVVAAATVRFKCSYDGTNNTATQIYDDYANHLVGTFSDSAKVKYIPFVWHFWDATVLRRQR